MSDQNKAYQPGEIESKWRQRWLDADCFRGDENSDAEAFSIVIPPPNVTGILHLGHVLNNTIQDILARRARQQGKAVLWLPGTDHAGIATQSKVEQKLRKEQGKTRRDLGREKFLEMVWDWKEEHGGIIIEQLKRLGCSCDWDRERFTMDEEYSKWISKVFVDLFNEGLIYRGKRMVNWCPKSLTALSDEEVIMKPQKSKLYYMRYKVVGSEKWLEIATTRPETLMGDTAVAVHPKDPRYIDLIGKNVWRPFPKAEIPIVASDHIDMEFGTGVLKVTPAHDKVDWDIGVQNGLDVIDVFNPDGTMNAVAGEEFEGMDRFDARRAAAKKLEEMGQLIRAEEYDNNVGFSERADVPIEPRISMQWFLKYPCVKEATDAVANDEITFRPERWKKTYLHWMENIQDWCISRQLWWGHQIPVWYRKEKADELQAAESLDKAVVESGDLYCGIEPPDDSEDWVRDDDVLDTWFSSWLWPFATMRDSGEESSATLAKFYPTCDLVTGPDILFFWVARMIMAGYRFEGELPFKNVFFTTLIRDRFGRKLAKQLGNSPDPLDIIDTLGADALRMALMRIAPLGSDVRFFEDREGFKGGEDRKAEKNFDACPSGGGQYPQVEEGRNFGNKVWQATSYRLMQGDAEAEPSAPSIFDIDILTKLESAENKLEAAYANYKFSEIGETLYNFFWSEYCDLYLESVKGDLRNGAPDRKARILATMDTVLGRFYQQLHPFMPHMTEELWEKLGFGGEGEFLMLTKLPAESPLAGLDAGDGAKRAAAVYQAANRARNLKAEYNLQSNKKVRFIVEPAGDWVGEATEVFALLANSAGAEIDLAYKPAKGEPSALTDIGKIFMPLEGLIDVDAEKKRLGGELEKIEKEIVKCESKLSNEKFVSNAKPEVVQTERDRLADWTTRKEQLLEMIAGLG
ncbi:MAG: valyl-tRNA synthetase [Verrucomicrobiales bacterium]|jgi:valyl-tRNA synthetase